MLFPEQLVLSYKSQSEYYNTLAHGIIVSKTKCWRFQNEGQVHQRIKLPFKRISKIHANVFSIDGHFTLHHNGKNPINILLLHTSKTKSCLYKNTQSFTIKCSASNGYAYKMK